MNDNEPGNVVSFKPKPVVQVEEGVIAVLEDALKDAKDGVLRSVCVVTVDNMGRVGENYFVGGPDGSHAEYNILTTAIGVTHHLHLVNIAERFVDEPEPPAPARG